MREPGPDNRWALRIDAHGWAFNRAGRAIGTIRPMPERPAKPDQPSRRRRQIPNQLTILRVMLAIAMFATLAIGLDAEPQPTPMAADRLVLFIAAALFILGAITDALDGYLARKWSVVSVFGRVMDPFADKLLVLGALVMLAGPGFVAIDTSTGPPVRYLASGVSAWIAVAILGRELLVTSIRAVAEGAGVNFQASWSGKWKMILQSIVVPIVLVMVATLDCRPGTWVRWTIDILVWATLAITLWSAIPYIRRIRGVMDSHT